MVEHLSFANEPRPFKDPNYRKNANRRNKALKQIIAGERIRARQAGAQRNGDATAAAAAAAAEAEASGSGDGGNGDATEDGAVRRPGQKGAGPSKKTKAAEAAAGPVGIASEADYLAYMTIEAPPSVLPPKKYCDITGLEAPYIDPKSRLRYHNTEVYELLKTFAPGTDQSYLALRGAHTMLR